MSPDVSRSSPSPSLRWKGPLIPHQSLLTALLVNVHGPQDCSRACSFCIPRTVSDVEVLQNSDAWLTYTSPLPATSPARLPSAHDQGDIVLARWLGCSTQPPQSSILRDTSPRMMGLHWRSSHSQPYGSIALITIWHPQKKKEKKGKSEPRYK